jgi:glycosyltransferase involved in cell wall biosynthesis
MYYRLGYLLPLPWGDPPSRVDIYDFDDAIYLGSDGAQSALTTALKRERQRWRAYVSTARLVLAGNSELAGQARLYARRVEVVPSCVEPSDYLPKKHLDAETLVVGWIGSPSTAGYLEPVIEALDRINKNSVRCRLVTVGAGASVDRPWAEAKPWKLASEKQDLCNFDVGVMPMPDTPWTRGKCGYKLLQYFAAGIPAVASPVGVAPQMIGPDRGVLARTTNDWINGITMLLADATVRSEMSRRARAHVAAHYSYEAWAPLVAEMFKELL